MDLKGAWDGWYDAPSPFGRTTFTLTILEVSENGDFHGEGEDSSGAFTIKGKLDGNKVEFVKGYKDPKGHQGIEYKGELSENSTEEDVKISGKYFYLYKTFVIKLNVSEAFQMQRVKS
eukprot:TRINITY_DN10197_c0_g1_i1.p1 TRINITY_DN10197_c0_g1~~TRINITY_DN10197_c0_g1_i1.p1  ORF type:complete len:118 (-),score=18.30 TRINITY_DN10197_c0_g1_i1:140-493(-)